MKKLALIIAAAALFSLGSTLGSRAQGMFGKGTQLFKFGVGINSNATPIEVGYEKGIKENFLGVDGLVLGLGANLGYFGYKEDFTVPSMSYSWSYTNIVIAGRALAHYSFIEKLDTYAGLMLGYDVASTKYTGPNAGSIPSPSAGGFVFGGVAGARYEFNANWGAYLEAGVGISNLNLGVAYKF